MGMKKVARTTEWRMQELTRLSEKHVKQLHKDWKERQNAPKNNEPKKDKGKTQLDESGK